MARGERHGAFPDALWRGANLAVLLGLVGVVGGPAGALGGALVGASAAIFAPLERCARRGEPSTPQAVFVPIVGFAVLFFVLVLAAILVAPPSRDATLIARLAFVAVPVMPIGFARVRGGSFGLQLGAGASSVLVWETVRAGVAFESLGGAHYRGDWWSFVVNVGLGWLVALLAYDLSGRLSPYRGAEPPARPRIVSGPRPTSTRTVVRTGILLRCAFCHGEADFQEPLCKFCGTILHVECWGEARRCPTLGCAARGGS